MAQTSQDHGAVEYSGSDISNAPKAQGISAPDNKEMPRSTDHDFEKGSMEGVTPPPTDKDTTEEEAPSKARMFYRRYRPFFHLAMWIIVTGWWTAGLALHHADKPWVVPFLIWLCATLRIITLYVSARHALTPVKWIWNHTITPAVNAIPQRARTPLGALGAIAVMCVGSFVSAETADNTRANRAISLFGLAVFIFVMWLTSKNRNAVKWQTVIVGMLMQFVIALFVLRTGVGFDIFNFISGLARSLLGFAGDGVAFLTVQDVVDNIHWFLVGVLPAIIFFVALVQLLYYVGFVQWFIGKFAVFFFWALKISGAEAVVAAATPFIGQGESAMLIKPFVNYLTKAELHQVMTSGFATISGSVLVAYIGIGVNPQALISACVMSIPSSLAMSKLRYPEEEESLTAGTVVVPTDEDNDKASNALHAFAKGAWLGLQIAFMILTTLLCIIALLGLVNGLLTWFGRYLNLEGEYDLTVQLILGYVCYPIAWLIGVPKPDLLKVSRLIGVKVIANEFVAYNMLKTDPAYKDLSPRSVIIATYSLCGFGNIGSLGTQIGVLSQIGPKRAGDVSRLAFSALITGVIATLTSASIAGLVVQS